MGQQQLLLIILGVIVVGIAIAVGVTMFGSSSVQSNKDAIINDISNLATDAYQFRIRPATLGGGGGSYSNYSIPQKLLSNDNGSYENSNDDDQVTFTGTSSQGYGTVTAECDRHGKLRNFDFTGEFQ